MRKKFLIIGIILFIICIICLISYFLTHKIITKDLTDYVEKTINIELSDVATGEDGKVVVDPGEEFAYICISLEKGSIEKIKARLDIEGNGIFPTEQGFTSMYDLRWNKLQTENINYIYNTFTEGKTSIRGTQKTRDMYIYLSTDNEGNEFLYLFG